MSYANPTKKERLARLEDQLEGLRIDVIRLSNVFDDTRKTVFAMQDQFQLATLNQRLSDEMPPKSPAQLRVEARQILKGQTEKEIQGKLGDSLRAATNFFFPTDDDLDALDALVDELLENRDGS